MNRDAQRCSKSFAAALPSCCAAEGMQRQRGRAPARRKARHHPLCSLIYQIPSQRVLLKGSAALTQCGPEGGRALGLGCVLACSPYVAPGEAPGAVPLPGCQSREEGFVLGFNPRLSPSMPGSTTFHVCCFFTWTAQKRGKKMHLAKKLDMTSLCREASPALPWWEMKLGSRTAVLPHALPGSRDKCLLTHILSPVRMPCLPKSK